ncbi:hypothetical protein PVAP13_6KG177800 [Panicum virgatum]|uniref:Uncharacterized protein n=1 Tax=Panicum virgatum TaxID=38727 RepID=A0A8T0RCB4_PANVG|nr:hypothetical protein PVAP13_6KG177800 [Panicum virgatum]
MNGLPFTHGFCLSILYQHMLSVSPVISCGRFSEYTQPPLPLAAGHSYGGGAGVQPQVLPVRFSLSYLECCEPYYMPQGSGQHCLPQPAQPMQHHWYPSPTTLADTFAGAGVLTKATHALPKDAKCNCEVVRLWIFKVHAPKLIKHGWTRGYSCSRNIWVLGPYELYHGGTSLRRAMYTILIRFL